MLRLCKRMQSNFTISKSNHLKIRNSLVEGQTTFDASPQAETCNWYACGPTVYDDAHIGHARTYVCSDIIRRIMTHKFHVKVNYSMGLTDIDDKIIDKSIAKGFKNWDEVRNMTNAYASEFMEDMSMLNVLKPYSILKVTDHVEEIIVYIENIVRNGYAYIIPNSGVYFDVNKLGDEYGKLGFGKQTDVHSNVNSTNVSLEKKDVRDFALWKFTNQGIKGMEDPDNSTVSSFKFDFESPWGRGRPGWHIECSALTHTLFGSKVDIHSGGIDLLFPHHTNEIAQCEAHNGKPWVRYWIHIGHLYIDGRKMSKSLKNFITIREFLLKHEEMMRSLSSSGNTNGCQKASSNAFACSPYPATDMRLCFLLYKYHAPIYFSADVFKEATHYRHQVEHLFDLINKTKAYVSTALQKEVEGGQLTSYTNMDTCKVNAYSMELTGKLLQCQRDVDAAYRNDFDTPNALAHMSALMHHTGVYCNNIIREVVTIPCPLEPVVAVASYVVDELSILGVEIPSLYPHPHFNTQSVDNSNPTSISKSVNAPDVVIDELVAFRANIRKMAIDGMKNIKKERFPAEISETDALLYQTVQLKRMEELQGILDLCDKLRDDVGVNRLGIDITDMNHGTTSWKYSVE